MWVKFSGGPLAGLARELDSATVGRLGAVVVALAYEPRDDGVALTHLWPEERPDDFRRAARARYTGRIWQTSEGLALCVEYVWEAGEED